MRKKMSILLVFVLVGVLLASCGGGAQDTTADEPDNSGETTDTTTGNENGSDEEFVMKFTFVTAPDSEKGLAGELFKQKLEERTDGRIRVELYPSGQLYDDAQSLEELPKNTIQMIAITATALVGFNPAFQIVDLPFLFESEEAVTRFWDGEGGEILTEKLGEHNLKYLGFWTNGYKHFANTERPLTSPEDFEGLTFRTMAGSVLEAQFNALGASSVTMPFPDVYPSLQQGTIEGIENTYVDIETMNFDEVTEHLTISEHARIDYVVLTNTIFWDSLPEDLQQIVEEVMAEVTEEEREIAKELTNDAYETLKERENVEFYELTEDDKAKFREALQPVYDEFTDVIGEDLIELARQANE